MHARQRGTQMRGHVVGTLVVVFVSARVFRGDGRKISLQIRAHCARCILLDQKGCGGVPAKERQKTGGHLLKADPGAHLFRDLLQTLAVGAQLEDVRNVAHGSTIQYRIPLLTGWATGCTTGRSAGKVRYMHRPPRTSKLADWRTGYALVISCRTCKHSRRTEPHSLAKLLGWDVPLIVVTARLRCSNCYAKDCEIQVDRLVSPQSVPKRLL